MNLVNTRSTSGAAPAACACVEHVAVRITKAITLATRAGQTVEILVN